MPNILVKSPIVCKIQFKITHCVAKLHTKYLIMPLNLCTVYKFAHICFKLHNICKSRQAPSVAFVENMSCMSLILHTHMSLISHTHTSYYARA